MNRTEIKNIKNIAVEVDNNNVKVFIHLKNLDCIYINLLDVGEFGHSEQAYIGQALRQIMHQQLLPNIA